MQTLSFSRSKTFPKAIEKAVDFHEPKVANDKNLFRNYAEAIRKFDGIANGLQTLCKVHLGFDFRVPVIPIMGAAEAAKPYPETVVLAKYNVSEAIGQLRKNMDVPQIGRIEWPDKETCHYTYFETDVRKTWDEIKTQRICYTHQLVGAREHRLDDVPVELPKRAKEIVKAIPQALHREVRIVTGTLVAEDATVIAERAEQTPLGWLVKGTPTKQVFKPDPAIVIGEFCLFGWK